MKRRRPLIHYPLHPLGSFRRSGLSLRLKRKRLPLYSINTKQHFNSRTPIRGTEKNVRTKRRSPIMVLFLILLCLIYGAYNVLDHRLKPAMISMASIIAHQKAAEIIHQTLYEEILPDIKYEEIITIHKDTQNQVNFIQANSMAIGKIATKTGSLIKDKLFKLSETTIQIPLAQALGIDIIANRGPKVSIILTPMGIVDVTVSDTFEQAGINQVKHTVFMDVKTKINIVVPLISQDEAVEMRIPLAESIIIGPIPDTYLSGGLTLHNIGAA